MLTHIDQMAGAEGSSLEEYWYRKAEKHGKPADDANYSVRLLLPILFQINIC
jgi:hypothetical protein